MLSARIIKLSGLLLAAVALAILSASPARAAALDGFKSWLSDNYLTEFNGFVETRGGVRLQDDPQQRDGSLGEARLQLDLNTDLDWAIVKFKGDLLGDLVTEEVAAEIKQRYPDREVVFCPDPSGKARKTSAPVGQTDFTILKRAGFAIHASNAATKVVDRVNNTQANLLSADGIEITPLKIEKARSVKTKVVMLKVVIFATCR